MKNQNIGGMCFVNSTWSAKKTPMQKCAKNEKNDQTLKIFPHSAFFKIHISGAANGHAPFQYAKYVFFFFVFFCFFVFLFLFFFSFMIRTL